MRLLGIIWAILDGEGLWLLEEPELYLHTEIIKQPPMFIANAQQLKNGKKRQVFISSHSYDILNTDTISVEEIAVLEQGKEDTLIMSASAVASITDKIEAGFTPADAVIPHVGAKDDILMSFIMNERGCTAAKFSVSPPPESPGIFACAPDSDKSSDTHSFCTVSFRTPR